MTNKQLDAAIAEAKRFLKAANALKERRAIDTALYEFSPCREGGACRRASMDLTRALTDLRRPA